MSENVIVNIYLEEASVGHDAPTSFPMYTQREHMTSDISNLTEVQQMDMEMGPYPFDKDTSK